MKTRNIFKTLAFAMMMPAMLLTTACSSEDELANNKNIDNTEAAINKGFSLPVTVNVTRQGDSDMRATFNESTRTLSFSAGDQLLVRGNDNSEGGAGRFAGMLDYDTEKGNFSGIIYTENSYSGTADALFTAANSNWVGAALFPNGYESYEFLSLSGSGYSTSYSMSYNKAIAATKAAAVEQFSLESAKTYSSGFALSPENAIFNFTITGLTDGAKDVTLKDGTRTMFTGSVTPTSGTAAFALGAMIKNYMDFPVNLKNVTLTIDGTDIDITDANKNLTAGKIYNITRNAIPGALVGKFSVSSTDKVYFSKGNLQYTKSTGIWSFMDHQYSTVETTSQAIGDDYASQNVVSLFGWGTSGWDNGNTYYQPYNTANVNNSSKGYGYGPKNGTTYTYDLTGTYANADWGLYNAISNGGNTANTWRTLTKDEWTYLLTTRSASTVNGTADARYAKAYLFGTTHGVIIFPDSYTHPAGVAAPTGINATDYTSWDGNRYTATDWAKMEAAGCVFLPAAGWRDATTIRKVNEYVRYWTSTYNSAGFAYNVGIMESNMNPANYNQKNYGYSVRLVHDAN